MHYTTMHVDANALLCTAKNYSGNWQNAPAAAGIEVEHTRHRGPT